LLTASPSVPADWTDSARAPRAVLLDSGAAYFRACAVCHGFNGRGGRGPAVASSDYVMADRGRLIRTVLYGVRDSIRVNGVRWNTGEMLGWGETWPDFRIAAVLTYVRAALNDSLVTACVPEDAKAGTWASCEMTPRDPAAIAADSIAVEEVAAVRAGQRDR
jgi:mono/diheme cytochrome c family protein